MQSFTTLLKLPLPYHTLIMQLSDNLDIITDDLVKKACLDGSNEKSAIRVLGALLSFAVAHTHNEIGIGSSSEGRKD